jgi:mRNA interferase RelE/StbE
LKILITNTFKRAAKKLHKQQAAILKEVIVKISDNPILGESKVGDLVGVRVYKFRILHQLVLLAYTYKEQPEEITLLAFSTHENFYKNLKIQLESSAH